MQLIIKSNEKPFIMLAGEVHNSNSSSTEAMEPIWEKAQQQEYDLPMSVNAWLSKGEEPGVFPSGGPVARVMEVWKYCAPHINVLSPDIYVQNFCDVCEEYTKKYENMKGEKHG